MKYIIIVFFLLISCFTFSQSSLKKEKNYRTNSVLNSGKWVKMEIKKDGIYKLSFSKLEELGFSNPENLAIYGSGGMLAKLNAEEFSSDLEENAVLVENNSLLFYAQGSTDWYLKNSSSFSYTQHDYSDVSYYYISEISNQNRIATENEVSEDQTKTITDFDDYLHHDADLVNLIKSGRTWYGENFDINNVQNFDFDFPNLKTSAEVKIKTSVLAHSTTESSFTIKANNELLKIDIISSISNAIHQAYAQISEKNFTIFSDKDKININLKYNPSSSSSEGYLDFILVQAKRHLKFENNQMKFRNLESIGENEISSFEIENANQNLKIWDITDKKNPKNIITNFINNKLYFKSKTENLKEFIIFNENYLSPKIIGEIENQNLHNDTNLDMVIVSHKDFLEYAEEVADLHREFDNFNVKVVTPEQVYNEFSYGVPDVSAIRNYMRFLHEAENNFNYLLLIGDGSYDNRTLPPDNAYYILTYQTKKSIKDSGSSYVSDDFFALLDSGEGENFFDNLTGYLDIAVGRFPVKNEEEMQGILNKLENYLNNVETMGDWRNKICFVADDGSDSDGYTIGHTEDANHLANMLDTTYNLNIEKIYLASNSQISSSAGETSPETNQSIRDCINKGSLIMNYFGHGNPSSWADERILNVNEINSWKNSYRLPLFITATCEFGRFDDKKINSAGEFAFLNAEGGAIAAWTTSRVVYAISNFNLVKKFYENIFNIDTITGNYNTIGEAIKIAKNKYGSSSESNKRCFVLMGDPALRLAYPKYKIVTKSINKKSVSEIPDTIKAFAKVTIQGEIFDNNNLKMSNFNGIVYPTVFDKKVSISTIYGITGRAPNFTTLDYTLQNNILYKGKATVKNGEFNFSFIVPKDISYEIGKGKISYYASSDLGNTDARGSFNNFIISGTENLENLDYEGPEIKLFMNDINFIDGGMTNENPELLVFLNDENGINTTGNGIGHDISVVLDENTAETMSLNEYYEGDLDTYKSGILKYKFNDLEEGVHQISLKAWDIFNNSSQEYLDFIVAKSNEMVLKNVFNYPNPFKNETVFSFQHNQNTSELLDVKIYIYSLNGQLVETINSKVSQSNGKIVWKGENSNGDKLKNGIYIYKVEVYNEKGQISVETKKLVILK